MSDESKSAGPDEEGAEAEEKKRLPKHIIKQINTALEAGMTPGQMEDAIYKKMFGCDDE